MRIVQRAGGALLLAGAFAGAFVSLNPAHAQEAAAPSALEREFWSSTQQIGTEAAYQAYLSRYPAGFFAPLARAAMAKGTASAASVAASASTAAATTAVAFEPAKIAGPTESRAITQQIGDVFYGPGPITVGWLGAKKQVVIPTGRWVLLGAEDGASGHATPITLTLLIFARLEPGGFRSFLLTRFNSRSGHPRSLWADAKSCEEPRLSAAFAWHDNSAEVNTCVTAALRGGGNVATLLSTPIWKTALNGIAAGGGAAPSGPYLVTDLWLTGDLSHYMKVTRVDFGVTAQRPEGSELSVSARRRWAEAYAKLAALDYRKKLDEAELYAGVKPAAATSSLPD